VGSIYSGMVFNYVNPVIAQIFCSSNSAWNKSRKGNQNCVQGVMQLQSGRTFPQYLIWSKIMSIYHQEVWLRNLCHDLKMSQEEMHKKHEVWQQELIEIEMKSKPGSQARTDALL
jgi:hypothetical protein